ncbi:MAG: SPASM domain-containing protein [Candidatus Omnitrophica bacterium]|nr:SPASM domain-containing protein [Candidatus Omnitrophota bacterium]MDD5552843.1 SPASM domain-containing protein [Candidatus Omnitrophota bacterium]
MHKTRKLNIIRKVYYYYLPFFIKYPLDNLSQYIRRSWKSYHAKPFCSEFPINVEIETAGFCNASCIFCPYTVTRKNSSQNFMDLQVFKKVIDECANFKVENIYLTLMNEPLLDKRIGELIRYAKEKCKSSRVAINTNASMLDKEMASAILDSGLDHITFSIHGWTNNTLKKVSGMDYNLIINNISNFINYSRSYDVSIGICCLKTRYFTKFDYLSGQKFCKYNNLPYVLLSPANRSGNLDEKLICQLNVRRYNKKIIRRCTLEDRPFTMMSILWDGDVVSCCNDWKKENVLGNVKEESLLEIWRGEKYQDFRGKIYNQKPSGVGFICKRCSESI